MEPFRKSLSGCFHNVCGGEWACPVDSGGSKPLGSGCERGYSLSSSSAVLPVPTAIGAWLQTPSTQRDFPRDG